MDHDLDAKYALAFGIDLERQPAAVQLEDRQIVHRSLDRYFPLGALVLALAIFRPVLVAHDGLDGPYIQRHAAAVNQGLKDLFHVPADFKQQVAAVFDLIVRVLVTKPALALFIKVEREAQAAGINPTLANPAQSPYSPLLGQGVCDLGQAGSVGDLSKAVALLAEADPGPARLAGDVFVTVEHHLGGERRVTADLDGDVAPVRIEDVKGIVVDVGHRRLTLEVMGAMVATDLPHRSPS